MASLRCSCCGKTFKDPPMDFHFGAPDAVPDAEREARCFLGPEQCEIDEERFLKGLLQVPVHGHDPPFVWGVWVKLRKKDYEHAGDVWEREGRENLPPYVGRLATELAPRYPSTLDLEARLRHRVVGLRGLVQLKLTDHPLALEQDRGMTRARLASLLHDLLHADGATPKAGEKTPRERTRRASAPRP